MKEKVKENKQTILLINGFKRSGKDYCAEYLNSKLDKSRIVSFANPMKEIISKTFNITKEELEDFKNDIEGYGIEVKAYPNNQPEVVVQYTNFREVLQRFGTEAMKPLFGNNVWTELAIKEATKDDSFILIPDFRFKVEYNLWDRNLFNIITIRVQDDNIRSTDLHVSETELLDFEFDYYVDNTNKDESVFESLDEIIEDIMELEN